MQNIIDYLRVSVTNKCNLKCIYCHPLSDNELSEYQDIMDTNEILHIIKLFVKCGIKRVRLTGGEPSLRNDILQLVNQLSLTEGIEDISVTTNGVLLESMAQDLKTAGLQRINISVDSLDKEVYKTITGFDVLENVTKGIQKAIEVGLKPVKINCVVVKGVNSSKEEIIPLAKMSIDLPVTVRFVEYYPTSNNSKLDKGFVPNIEIKKIIEQTFGTLDNTSEIKGYGPAQNFKIKNSVGAIGFISGRSTMFCDQCNRIRLSCDGKLKPCLYSAKQYDIRELLSKCASEENVLAKMKYIIQKKSNYNKKTRPMEEFSMQSIGG
ncbi:MAG: GTP 3',8-cyclase MoaA [Sedimentisphaerales bacterium]|nr:GTP 3',8-cyclase MoaA [Sedimentisphaerales bacterium]